MKRKLKIILSLLLGGTALAQTPITNQNEPYYNFIRNGGFEQGKSPWTSTGASFYTVAQSASVGSGSSAMAWNAASSGKVLQSEWVNIPAGFFGTAGAARCRVKTGTTDTLLEVLGGSQTIASKTLVGNAKYQEFAQGFIFPNAGSIALRLKSQSSASTMYVDDCFLGANFSTFSGVVPWFIDVDIQGADIALGSTTLSTFTVFNDAGLTLTPGLGSAPVQIPCSGTNPSTGATCAAGNEEPGVVFTPPAAGYYKVCGTFAHNTACTAAGNYNEMWFAFVETPNTSDSTLTQIGTNNSHSRCSADGNFWFPHRLCNEFYFSSVAQRTIRLMRKQVNGTGAIGNNMPATSPSTIHIEVSRMDAVP